jgi:hypothetical protein
VPTKIISGYQATPSRSADFFAQKMLAERAAGNGASQGHDVAIGKPFKALSRKSRRDSELAASCHMTRVIRPSRIVNCLEN